MAGQGAEEGASEIVDALIRIIEEHGLIGVLILAGAWIARPAVPCMIQALVDDRKNRREHELQLRRLEQDAEMRHTARTHGSDEQ